MSTQYHILDNRPINKWKVIELKEELKKRNLKITGLKDDLVKRLDEAIRNELAALETQTVENLDDKNEHVDSDSTINETATTQPSSADGAHESDKTEEDGIAKSSHNDFVLAGEPRGLEVSIESNGITNVAEQRVDNVNTIMDNEALKLSGKEALENSRVNTGTDIMEHGKKDDVLVEELGMTDASVESVGVFSVAAGDQITASDRTLQDMNTKVDSDDVCVTAVPSGEKLLEKQDSEDQKEVFKPLQMDAECNVPNPSNQLHHVSYPSNQVHEVSNNTEFQVKSEPMSTDTLSFKHNKELKDNLNADTVQLEPEGFSPEQVQPSSTKNLSHDGIFHPLDDGLPGGDQGFVGEIDDETSRNTEVNHKNDNAENNKSAKVGEDNKVTHVSITKFTSPEHAAEPERTESSVGKSGSADTLKEGSSQDLDYRKMEKVDDGDHLEKINLEQSSADDSMEEDLSEARPINFDQNAAVVSKKTEPVDESGTGERGSTGAMLTDIPTDKVEPFLVSNDHTTSGIPSDKLESFHDNKDNIAFSSDKRRFQEITTDEREPPKRRRRWNSENVMVTGQQSSGVSDSPKPKNLFEALPEKLNVSGPAVEEDASKERIVPPSAKTPTNSLRIDNFLRPFTLKAVQELLGKTSKICDFWMDQIKTHCYVTYSTVEESIDTRNAVYNLQWPKNFGRLLIADFVDPEEVKQRIEAPPESAPPVTSSPSVVPIQTQTQPLQLCQQDTKKQSEPQHPLSRELPASGRPMLQERLSQAPSRTVPEEIEPPMRTLDDLFRKTKATPRIYYLPLTEEQVAAKVQKEDKL